MKKFAISLITVLLLTSCGSTRLIESTKDEDTPVFEANKVLVIGLTQELQNRRLFEEQLASQLEQKGVVAVRSSDFFENLFTDDLTAEQQLDKIETNLVDSGFDAILLSRILGIETKTTVVQSFRDLDNTYNGFRDDYLFSQNLIEDQPETANYQLYHTQTSLYCICPDKEREQLWDAKIDIVERRLAPNIRSYVNLLIKTLKRDQYLIVD
ncbi:MAG: hypothetical protein ABJM06_13985 [Gilvibacter sp.]